MKIRVPRLPCSNSIWPGPSCWVVGSIPSSQELGNQLDDLVGNGEEAVVVGGDGHDPAFGRQFGDQMEDAFDLDVVEVSRRLVGQDERRIQGQGRAMATRCC